VYALAGEDAESFAVYCAASFEDHRHITALSLNDRKRRK
jgi:hypothetical protein